EFMESAFVNYYDISHLFIHEIAHFIYFNTLSGGLKNEWINLGEWYEDENSQTNWATKNETQFVSAYAHDKTPEEDFAESIAAFVLNSKLLNSRSEMKYEWIKKNLFGGSFYVSSGTHMFSVINLGSGSYYFPGKVHKVKAVVLGAPNEDKKVRIDITLLADKKGSEDGCAIYAYSRFVSEQLTFKDIYFKTSDNSTCSHTLYAEFEMNKNESKGRWVFESLTFVGLNNIQRHLGVGSFVLYFYVNNDNEDIEAPIPLLDSVAVYKQNSDGITDALIRVNMLLLEDNTLKTHGGAYVNVASALGNTYSFSHYTYEAHNPEMDVSKLYSDYFVSNPQTNGFRQVSTKACKQYTTDDISNLKCFQIINTLHIPKHCASGKYYVRQIGLIDEAGNENTTNIPSNTFSAYIEPSGNLDTTAPTISNVRVTSKPANDQSDGETIVNVDFVAEDYISKIISINITLRDPNGGMHTTYFGHGELPSRNKKKYY
ncbi:sporozoite invasion-associated protein 1, putative, partial [Hepatocystis sp. ex Piliocolobus tephrosceles]